MSLGHCVSYHNFPEGAETSTLANRVRKEWGSFDESQGAVGKGTESCVNQRRRLYQQEEEPHEVLASCQDTLQGRLKRDNETELGRAAKLYISFAWLKPKLYVAPG